MAMAMAMAMGWRRRCCARSNGPSAHHRYPGSLRHSGVRCMYVGFWASYAHVYVCWFSAALSDVMHVCTRTSSAHVCIVVCIHACMYACMHVCMYVCRYVCMHVRTYFLCGVVSMRHTFARELACVAGNPRAAPEAPCVLSPIAGMCVLATRRSGDERRIG